MSAITSRLLRHPVAQNAMYLFGVRVAGYVFPLISLPYLMRVLGAQHFGTIALVQGFALWLALIGEYGFNLSATREIAQVREDSDHVARVVSSVTGAKGLLLAGMFLMAVAVARYIPALRERPDLVMWGLLIAVGQSFSPLWYFQGIERMRGPAVFDVIARFVHLILIFLFVKVPSDDWKALAGQAAVGGLFTAVTSSMMYRQVVWRTPTFYSSWSALGSGLQLFLFRAANSLYTSANSLILGLLANPLQVAFFVPAERVVKAFLAMLWPVTQALYPQISSLTGKDRDKGLKMGWYGMVGMIIWGVILGGLLALAAPWTTAWVFGPEYERTLPVLRVLSLSVPVVALGSAISMHIMLPLGLDREFNLSVFAAGLTNLLLAALLSPLLGAIGMAIAVVTAEGCATLVRVFLVWRRGLLYGLWQPGDR